MHKYTIQERFYVFVAITMISFYCYGFYYHHQQDKYIHQAIEDGNKKVNRYVEINNGIRVENEGLKHDLIHSQALYEASKGHCSRLEEQIDLVNEYWKMELMKISSELFDLKNSPSNLDR